MEPPLTNLRQVNLRRDLAQIADLLEICFTDMDSSGKSAIREMRMLAHSGPLLWALQSMDRMVQGLMQGYIWEEDGQLVGNVSIYPAGHEQTWVIANVAVHPAYRRRGIAEALCEKALERIVALGGNSSILQVDANNPTAQRVYQRLGFYEERTFTRWRWRETDRAPKTLPGMPFITYRSRPEWKAAYQLAQLVRPNQRGGLGWLRPTRESFFRPGVFRSMGRLFSTTVHEEWVTRGEKRRLESLLLTEIPFGASYLRFDMLVHPERAGWLEPFLVNYVMRHASSQYRGAVTEHPADDQEASRFFQQNHFLAERTQIHMRWNK